MHLINKIGKSLIMIECVAVLSGIDPARIGLVSREILDWLNRQCMKRGDLAE